MGAKARISETGEVLLPQDLRDAYGLKPGSEIDIADDGARIVLTPATVVEPEDEARRLAVEAFLASIPRYDGPPVDLSPEAIREGIDRLAIEDWQRLERQWGEADNEANKDD